VKGVGAVPTPPAGSAPVYRPAGREETVAALGFVLGTAAHPADDAHVYDFLRFAQRRGIEASAAWLADAGGSLAWAVLPIVSPGRTMLILGPVGGPAQPAVLRLAGELIDAVCAHYAARDVQLAQVLLDPNDAASQRLYEGRAFHRVAELIYLQVAPRRKAAAPALPPGLRWVGYGPETHALFGRAILSTYERSLDCPSLNGLRGVEDVIAGHKASGEFDPRLWGALCEGERPLGVLLLARAAPGETTELVYLGLAPAARGRGLGGGMMRQALAAAAADGAARLSLAVDAGNAPALKLYYRHGMQRVGAKLAMMRRLDAPRGA
jgi:ribosomal protein S18 acetylase RimI-like enzyme